LSNPLRRRERRFESCRGHVTELQQRSVIDRVLQIKVAFTLP
jgi:hypothetical protein